MAITAAAIDRLKAQLLTSGLSQQNQPLFQIINQLIGAVRQSLEGVEAINGTGGGGSGIAGQSFATLDDDTATLPNSSQLLPGQAIEFQRLGGRTFIHAAIPLGGDGGGEGGEDGPPGPQGPPGGVGPAGPTGSSGLSTFYAFDGIDGEDAPILPGPQGVAGTTGAAGLIGSQGIPGNDGEDGYDSLLPGPPGSVGQTGLQGIQGIQGIMGPSGLDADEPNEPMMIPGPPGAIGGTLGLLRTLANQTINAGAATFVDITGLTFPVVNGRDYAFTFYIVFQSALATTGWKAGVNHPGGTVDFFSAVQTVANAAAGAATFPFRHNTVVDDMTLLTATVTANVDLCVTFQGRYKCTTNGTFAARFANELAADTNIVVQKGSWGFYF